MPGAWHSCWGLLLPAAGSALHSNLATCAFQQFYSSKHASLIFICWEMETNEVMWVINSNFPLQTEGLQAVLYTKVIHCSIQHSDTWIKIGITLKKIMLQRHSNKNRLHLHLWFVCGYCSSSSIFLLNICVSDVFQNSWGKRTESVSISCKFNWKWM